MKNYIMIQGSPEDFQQPIIDSLKNELEALKKQFQPKEPEEFLNRQEVAEMLRVDLSSVHNYRNRGIFTAYQIGGRVLYKRSEIEAAMVKLNISRK